MAVAKLLIGGTPECGGAPSPRLDGRSRRSSRRARGVGQCPGLRSLRARCGDRDDAVGGRRGDRRPGRIPGLRRTALPEWWALTLQNSAHGNDPRYPARRRHRPLRPSRACCSSPASSRRPPSACWSRSGRPGAAPLTVYTLHVLAAAAATVALASVGQIDAPADLRLLVPRPGILGVHILGALVVGAILAALQRRGPLEALVSSISGAVARRWERWLPAGDAGATERRADREADSGPRDGSEHGDREVAASCAHSGITER